MRGRRAWNRCASSSWDIIHQPPQGSTSDVSKDEAGGEGPEDPDQGSPSPPTPATAGQAPAHPGQVWVTPFPHPETPTWRIGNARRSVWRTAGAVKPSCRVVGTDSIYRHISEIDAGFSVQHRRHGRDRVVVGNGARGGAEWRGGVCGAVQRVTTTVSSGWCPRRRRSAYRWSGVT